MEHIEKDDVKRARSFALEIRTKTNRLAQFPEMGRPGRVTDTRELVIHPNYIIPYRIRADVVEIYLTRQAAFFKPPHAR